MANEKLSIELTAKIDGLRDSFNQAIREVNSYDKETKAKLASVDKGFAQLASDIEKSLSGISASTVKASSQITKSLAQAAQVSASSGKSIKAGSNEAAFALTNLGRVAQDAPFGFIGIQNNLNPLLESFQRLKVETGSSSAAMKALTQSLIGPAGIGLALSLVSSAVLFYQQYQQKANKTTKEAESANKSLAETYADLNKEIKSISDSRGFGVLNASDDLAKLAQLYSASQDINISYKDRKKVVEELQRQYPTTFKNFSDEEILAGKASKAYEALNKQLINKAIIQANTENISKAIKPLLAIGETANKTAKEIQDARKVLANPLSGVDELSKAKKIVEKSGLVETFAGFNKKTKQGYIDNINDMLKAGNELIKEFGADIIVTPDTNKAKKEIEKIGKLGTGGIFGDLGFKSIDSKVDLIVRPIKKIQTETEYALASLRGNFDYTDEQIERFVSNYGQSAVTLLALAEKFNEDFNAVAFSGISDTLSSLGSSIGEAFASGNNVLEAAGQSLLASIGNILVEFGKLTLAAGVAATALGQALRNPLNPANAALAIGAGVALIAIGTAVKAFSGKIGGSSKTSSGSSDKPRSIPQFASGVNNFSGGMALVGERGPELIDLPTGASVIPNGRTERMISRANTGNVELMGSLEVGLDKLYVRLQQTGKKLGRLG